MVSEENPSENNTNINVRVLDPSIPQPINSESNVNDDTKLDVCVKEETKTELDDDVNYILTCMVNAYNSGNNASYEMYVIHLMDIIEENPFKEGTEEYNLFDEMMINCKRVPTNKRRAIVVGKQLCELINNTEIYPEKVQTKQTVLGVIPEEKKNWLKFLFPWRKEGDQDDSQRAN